MSSQTYLEALGTALSRLVPIQEQMNILRYYKEYFEDAGPEQEQALIRELGDPAELAEKIAREGGWLEEERPELPQRPRRRVWPLVLAVCVTLVVITATVGGLLFAFNVVKRVSGWNTAYGSAGSVAVSEENDMEYILGGSETVWGGDTVAEDFSRIEVDIDLGNVVIEYGDDYRVIADNGGSSGYSIGCRRTEDGTLSVFSASSGNVNIGSLKELGGVVNAQVWVTVPRGFLLDDVNVNTGLGNITLVEFGAAGVCAETGMGDIQAVNMPGVHTLSLKSGMGDVVLDGFAASQMELDTGMGSVSAHLACAEQECDYELDTGLGEVTVNGASHGQKSTRKLGGTYSLHAGSGMGSIDVSFA